MKKLKEPEKAAAARKMHELPWRHVSIRIAAEYDLAYLGGWSFLKDDKALPLHYRRLVDALIPQPPPRAPAGSFVPLNVP
jgi:hypothetical protein